MPIDNNAQKPTEDDIYLAKMTMDEVGADIEQHGHVAVTNENRTQDPFTIKGSLANALDEALDYSNPNYDPTNESQGDVEGITNDPQLPKKSDEEIKPDDTTMDKAPEVPDAITNNKESKTVKDSLSEALDSVFAMDAVTEVPEEADDEAHHKWQAEEIKKNVPQIPESMGGGDKPDSNGLIYLDYTFTVDPAKYNSPNYQPIANAGEVGKNKPNAIKDPNEQAANDKVDEDISVEETIVEAGGEPSKGAEKEAAKEANENEKEVNSIGKPIEEKKAEDEAPEKVVLDYATFIDGSSFLCFDEGTGVDYTKIVMDAGPKKPVTRQTCKTTFAQCRAKNPLFCRFHGPKLLEKDIKSAISAALGKGCVVSVTKDKGQKNPLTFRLTIGCPPAMKKDVEKIVHMFMTQNPGISSPEEYKDLGNGKQTTEFDMDILKADEPPKKNDLKGQAAQWETEKAKAKGKTMPVVGETPPKVEKLANEGGVQKTDVQQPPVEEEVEEKVEENVEQPISTTSIEKEAAEVPSTKKGNYIVNEEVENNEKQKEFSALVDKAIDEGYFRNKQFQNEYDGIVSVFGEDAFTMEQKTKALKALMEKYKPTETEEEKVEENAEQSTGGDGLDLEAIKAAISNSTRKLGLYIYYPDDYKIIPTDTGFTVKGQTSLKGANDVLEEIISAVKALGYDTKGYDAQSAQIEFYPKKPVSDVKGKEGEKKDKAEAKKEATLAKVKEALKGTGYENGDFQYADFGDEGEEVYIANTDKGTLEVAINKDGEMVFGVHDDYGGSWANSAQEAIKNFEENYGGKANGGKDSSDTFAKIKKDLEKGFEDGDQQIDLVKSIWDIVSEADSNDDLAKDIKATLLDVMELDEEGYPTIDKDVDVGNYDSPMIYAIHQIQSLVDKHEDGLDDSSKTPSGSHFVDEAAMKMTGEIDDLAHENPELISGDDQVSALYYAAHYAINAIDDAKKNLEEIDQKLKKMSDIPPSAANALAKKALEGVKQVQQETYDSAKANAELSVKNFKEAMEKAKANIVDSIKGTNAEMVENIVKTTARAIFPQGKPDGVETVADMIDAIDEEKVSLINDKLMVNGVVSQEDLSELHFIESKHSFIKKYKNVEKARKEFDEAVSSFKDLIDGVKSKAGAESLKEAVNGIGEYALKLKDAFAAYKMAVENVKKDVSDLAEMKEKEKKLSQSSGNDQPSEEEIKDAAKKLAIDQSYSDVDGFMNYAANEISKVISGDGYPKNVDKELPNIGSRRAMAEHYLYLLKKLNGVSPSVIAALQKVMDMPKWGEKTKKKTQSQSSSENTMDLSSDFAKYVGLDTESDGRLKSASADFYPNLANAISAALQKDGHFTNFNTTNDYDSHELYLSVEKKQKEGFDEDEDEPEIPTDEEKSNVEYMLLHELGKVGLALDFSTTKQFGPQLTWQIVAKPKATKENTTAQVSQATNPESSIKAKIDAMSNKEIMEKSIPILEKKLKLEPNNEKWQKMLKIAKAYLAAHSSEDDDYLE